jgi:intraflagellar transport protein 140
MFVIIAENLGPDTDPAVLAKCGDFFLQNGHFEKAVHLFIGAKAYNKALDLCIKHDVKINDGMAESLTPPKIDRDSKDGEGGEVKTPRGAPPVGPDGKEMTNEQRQAILLRLAQACHDQRSYHLACKKYTQAGDQVKAIRCLTKSDDNEKIIYYASMID